MSTGLIITGTATDLPTLSLSDIAALAGITLPSSWASISINNLNTTLDTGAHNYTLNFEADAQLELPGLPGFKLINGQFGLTATKEAKKKNKGGGTGDIKAKKKKKKDKYDYDLTFSGLVKLTYKTHSYLLNVKGSYDDNAGTPTWTATISSQQEIKVGAVISFLLQKTDLTSFEFLSSALDIDINQFSFTGTHQPTAGGGGNTGEVATPGSDTFSANVDFDWDIKFPGTGLAWPIKNASIVASKTTGDSPTVNASCTTVLPEIGATVDLSYDLTGTGQSISMTWEGITATYTVNTDTLTFKADNWSVGKIIQSLISTLSGIEGFKLDAPWDLLNDIVIQELEVTYDFKTKGISLTCDFDSSINLFFIDIYGFTITRGSVPGGGGNDVFMKLNAHLLVENIDIHVGNGPPKNKNAGAWGNLLGKNSSAAQGQSLQKMPSVPGKGNKYFELEYLGMGQRVELSKAAFADSNTVGEVVKNLSTALTSPVPAGQVLPGKLQFNASSDWLFGTEMTLLDAITLGVVFNDPVLYGLLIEVTGGSSTGKKKNKGAKILKALKGLKFEILYKKISNTIGMYFIELKLPSEFRHLQFGEVAVTLPVISLNIYTNGNFKIDIGYPASLTDWSNCLTIQAFPFTGSGGFYFADLSQATAKGLPVTSHGTFNPVIEFGFAANLGLGKSIHKGVLKAGISVVALGSLQGTIAWYHPGDGSEKSTYYKLLGTVGVLGKVYGQINFAIVQASVNLTITATATTMLESYHSIPLSLYAEVEATAEVSISLVFFTIHLSFSFHTSISENMTIGHNSAAPWDSTGGGQQLLSQMTDLANVDATVTPNWSAFKGHTGVLPDLQLYFTPHLTFDSATDPLYIAMLYINSPKSDDTGSTSIEQLCNKLFLWLINSMEGVAGQTLTDTGADAVTSEKLKAYLAALNAGTNLFAVAEIEAFITQEFQVMIAGPGDFAEHAPSVGGAMFPMFPELKMQYETTKGVGENSGEQVTFNEFAIAEAGYFEKVREYTQQTATDYEKDLGEAHVVPTLPSGGLSIADYVFQDYFLMLSKAMLQHGIDYLDTYELSTGTIGSKSLSGISTYYTGISADNNVNTTSLAQQNSSLLLGTGIDLAMNSFSMESGESYTAQSLCTMLGVDLGSFLEANLTTADFYAPHTPLSFTVNGDTMSFVTNGGESLQGLLFQAEEEFLFLTKAVPTELISQNSTPLNLGVSYLIPSILHHIKSTDTLESICTNALIKANVNDSVVFAASSGSATANVEALLNANLLTQNIFRPGTEIAVPPPWGIEGPQPQQYTVKEGDTLQSILAVYGLNSISEFASQHAAAFTALYSAANLSSNVSLIIPAITYTTGATDTLTALATAYKLTVSDLANCNQNVDDFWAKSQKVKIPGLQALTASTIASGITAPQIVAGELAPSSTLLDLAGLGSRIFMTGLRLPASSKLTVNGPSNIPGVSASSAGGESPDAYSLYRLTGQEIPANASTDFSMTLELTGSAYKVGLSAAPPEDIGLLSRTREKLSEVFEGEQAPITSIVYPLTSQDVTQITTMESKLAGLDLSQIATVTNPVSTVATHISLGKGTEWKYPGTSVITGAHAPYSLFKLPKHAQDYLSVADGAGVLNLFSTNHDLPINAGTNPAPQTDLLWCTSVKVEVKELPSVSMTAGACYELLGVDQTDLPLLNALLTAIDGDTAKANSLIKGFYLLYRPVAQSKSPGGYQSSNVTDQQMQITQADLSMFSGLITAASIIGDEPAASGSGVENSNLNFLQLLTQASIENKGGYYLYFNDKVSGKGIPANVFNQKSIGEVELLIDYGTPAALPAYVNALVADAPAVSKHTSFHLDTSPGQTKDTLNLPLGNYNFKLTRPNPSSLGLTKTSETLSLLQNYSLLTYELQEDDNFNASAPGLPMNPKTESGDTTTWVYEHAMPLYKYSKAATSDLKIKGIDNSKSPYLGIGKEATIDFNWVDLFGNKLLTPKPASLPITLTYCDELIGLNKLPGLSINYLIVGGVLELNFEFSVTKYHFGSSKPAKVAEGLKRAYHDLYTYTQSWYQVQDLLVNQDYMKSFYVFCTLDTDKEIQYNPNKSDLQGLYKPIVKYLSAVIKAGNKSQVEHDIGGQVIAIDPPNKLTSTWSCGATSISNSSPIFELEVLLGMYRNVRWLNPDIEADTGDYTSWNMSVKPDTEPATGETHHSLRHFANQFEEGYNNGNGNLLYKIAIGEDKLHDVGKPSTKIWVVQFGASMIQLQLVAGGGSYYAMAPLSNSIVNLDAVTVTEYDAASAYSTTTKSKNFSSINLDKWGKTVLEAIDEILLPQYAVPASIIGNGAANGDANVYKSLLYAKKQIAETISGNLLPIFGSMAISSSGKDRFKEQLLERLSAAYSTEAIIETPIITSVPSLPSEMAAQLIKLEVKPKPAASSNDKHHNYSLSNSDIAISTTAADSSTVITTLLALKGAATKSVLELKNLEYQLTHVQHQISPDASLDNVEVGNWLSFLRPVTTSELNEIAKIDLTNESDMEVPLLLRSYPTPPSILGQTFATDKVDNPTAVSDLLTWDYELTYSASEAAQDVLTSDISYNVLKASAVSPASTTPSTFETGLASFINNYDWIKNELPLALAKVDFETNTSGATYKTASEALGAFVALVKAVAANWPSTAATIAPANPNTLIEASGKAGRLKISTWNNGPTVSIPGSGYEMKNDSRSPGSFYFKNKTSGDYLLYADRNKYQQRTLSFNNLSLLDQQSAWAGVSILRNQDLLGAGGAQTTGSFLYQSPMVRQKNAMVPFVQHPLPYDLAAMLLTGRKTTASIAKYLNGLLAAVFPSGFDMTTVALRFQIDYRYRLTVNSQSDITLPMVLTTLHEYSKPGKTGNADLTTLATYIETWVSDKNLTTDTTAGDTSAQHYLGRVNIKVEMFSDLTSQKLIASLDQLYLPVENIKWS